MANLLDPGEFTAEFDKLTTSANNIRAMVDQHRLHRKNRVNVDVLRSKKILNAAETYIGARIIDENINRDMPNFLSFLKQSRRLAIFTPIGVPDGAISVEPLEMAFTNNMRYQDWEVDYVRLIDGGSLHGFDVVEVSHNKTKPGHTAVNHVGLDHVKFNGDFEDIEQSPMVSRSFNISSVDLDKYVQQGTFDLAEGVDEVREKLCGGDGKVSSSITIDQVYFKVLGVVHVCWYCKDVNKQLSSPRKFRNGLFNKKIEQQPAAAAPPQLPGMPAAPAPMAMAEPIVTWIPADETEYPFVIFFTSLTEERKISEQEGHGERDYYMQDAICVLQSAAVNGVVQASKTMWAPDSDNYASAGNPGFIDMAIKNGAIWKTPMRAFSAPYPAAELFRALESMRTANATSNNHIDFAVNNREDSRKTATEIQSAQQQSSQINSVQVLFLSIVVRRIMKRAFAIMKCAWQMGAIKPTFDIAILDNRFEIQSAGDIDFIQRQETIAAMQQDMQILGATPAGPMFLADYLRLRYPTTAERYISALQTPNDVQLITGLAQTLQQIATNETGNIRPDLAALAPQLQQLAAAVQQRLAAAAAMAPPTGSAKTPPATGGGNGGATPAPFGGGAKP